ncbi:MAG: hypothetical protein E7330_03350 [Clostridiales bacterium]|nr:hypothetical protein [Clostridiales bacterium]
MSMRKRPASAVPCFRACSAEAMESPLQQIPVFLGALYGGIVIGLVFTAFRPLHALFGSGRIADGILDALFYALAGVIAALTIYRINGGTLRLYVIAGLLLGVFLEIRSIDALLCLLVEKGKALQAKFIKKRL